MMRKRTSKKQKRKIDKKRDHDHALVHHRNHDHHLDLAHDLKVSHHPDHDHDRVHVRDLDLVDIGEGNESDSIVFKVSLLQSAFLNKHPCTVLFGNCTRINPYFPVQ